MFVIQVYILYYNPYVAHTEEKQGLIYYLSALGVTS